MRSGKPRRPQGSNAEAIFAQSVWDMLWGGGLDFIDTPTVKFSKTSRGISAKAKFESSAATPTSTYPLKRGTLLSVSNDTLSVSVAGVSVTVSKPAALRQALANGTIDGASMTYVFPNGSTRDAYVNGTFVETQIILPRYIVGGIIWICEPDYATSTQATPGNAYLDANIDGRAWARKYV